MTMKRIGLGALWAGVLGGAFVSVRHTDAIEWGAYAAAAVLALAGVILLRRSAAATASDGARVERDVGSLHDSAAQLVARLDAIVAERATLGVYEVKDRIDGALVEPLGVFADRREALIVAHGLDVYADVMTHFAHGERLINRAWSASADGYVDEVWRCVEAAQTLMQQARDRLVARGTPTSEP